ncbi:MAG: class I SAM-dependent methyltransferase [Acidimicrobiales bacterium]
MSDFRWDAERYASLPLPHILWGQRVIDAARIPQNGKVLDLGCGTGRDAQTLLQQRPDLQIFAIDRSEEMLAQFRSELGDASMGITLLVGDLRAPLPHDLSELDAVISVATLHWIHDHAQVFRNLVPHLRPGASLTYECGGAGNIADMRRVLRSVLGDDYGEEPWYFARPQDERSILESLGFEVHRCELREDPTPSMEPRVFRECVRTLILGPYLVAMADDVGQRFTDQVIDALASPHIDYVRLEVSATFRGQGAPQ